MSFLLFRINLELFKAGDAMSSPAIVSSTEIKLTHTYLLKLVHLNNERSLNGILFSGFSGHSRKEQVGFHMTKSMTKISAIIEWFSLECRKTETKVNTLTNHNRRGQSNEPIRTRKKRRVAGAKRRKMRASKSRLLFV